MGSEETKSKNDQDDSAGLVSRLLESRTVIISGQTDSQLAQKVLQQLILLDHANPKARITLLINSPGGEVFSGFAIFDTIRFIAAPVITVVVGLAASMGSILALAAPKGGRFTTPNAKFLIHQPLLMGYQGRATDLEIQAKEILKDRERIIKLYAESTGKDAKDVSRDIDRDKWMTAEEALAYGLVDRIVKTRAEIPAA